MHDPADYELPTLAVCSHILDGVPIDLRPVRDARNGDIPLVGLSDAAHVIEDRDRTIARLRNELANARGTDRYA